MNESVLPVAHASADGGFRFRAFISYAHRDEPAARARHRALEVYRVPSRLVGQDTCLGPAPRRLGRFFRDRDELSAVGQLSDVLKAALADSQFLIVVVSTAAAASKWVNEEVRQFKLMGREERILAYIPPGAGGTTDALFPQTLRFELEPDGSLSDRRAEPIAADARKSGDGVRLARLKLIAGLTCLPLDDIIRRDAARRQRVLAIAVVAASLLAVAMAWLAAQALRGRAEAERQRAEAEGLIEFMLTDLRAKLEPVGRLEVLDSVGQRALAYYGGQTLDRLSADELGRRARALLLVGEVRDLRGDSEAALAAFLEAERTTAELLARDPANPDRMFDHAQSVFHVGNIAWQRDDLATVEVKFRAYDQLAAAMVATDPTNPRWLQEQSYAHTNLGVFYRDSGRLEEAVGRFGKAVAIDEALLRARGDAIDSEGRYALAQSLAWHADGLRDTGRFAEARAARQQELRLHDAMLAEDPRHAEALDAKGTALNGLARIHLVEGNPGAAATEAAAALAILRQRLAEEPENQLLREQLVSAATTRVEALLLAGTLAAADRDSAMAVADAVQLGGGSTSERHLALLVQARAQRALLLRAQGKRAEADALAAQALADGAASAGANVERALLLLVQALDRRARGDTTAARLAAGEARALLMPAILPRERVLVAAIDRRFPPAASLPSPPPPAEGSAPAWPVDRLLALAGHPPPR